MNEKLTNKLKKEFPNIIPSEFTISCGDGLYKLLRKTCESLQFISDISGMKITINDIHVSFGTLVIHYSTYKLGEPKFIGKFPEKPLPLDEKDKAFYKETTAWGNIISDVIHYAEYRSNFTCTECGEHGFMAAFDDGINILCMTHNSEKTARQIKQRKRYECK